MVGPVLRIRFFFILAVARDKLQMYEQRLGLQVHTLVQNAQLLLLLKCQSY